MNLTAKVPRINMAIAVPAEISGFAGSLVASVGDIARAVIDALIDGRPAVDGTPVGDDDARGRVAKR